jgi:PAS domain S-box-containing protein
MKLERTKIKWVFGLLGIIAVYYLSARLGLLLAFEKTNVSPVWPPSGIALAAILLFGYRIWPAILVGAFLGNLDVFLDNKIMNSWTVTYVSAAIALGNTLEAVLGRFLILRMTSTVTPFYRTQDVFKFIGLTLSICLVAASIGTSVLTFAGISSWSLYKLVWFTWWLGDATGIFVLTPLFLVWIHPATLKWTLYRWMEAALLLIGIVLSSGIVFAGWFTGNSHIASAFILIPSLVWAAFRFNQRVATLMIFGISVFTVWQTLHGFGPFTGKSVHASLLLLQGFIGVISGTVLSMTADVSERRKAERDLREARDELEDRVRERTAEVAQANDELRKNAKQLADAQKISHMGSWEWDLQTNTITWSDELYRIYGLTRKEFVASYEGFINRVHPDDRQNVSKVIDAAYKSHKTFSFYHRIVQPSGKERMIHASGEVVLEAGKAVRMIGTAQDVTELKQTEDALQASEGKFRSVAESTSDGIVLADQAGMIISWNEGAGKIFGYTQEEVMGKALTCLMPERYKQAHIHGLKHYMETGKDHVVGKTIEVYGLRKGGEEFPLQLSLCTWETSSQKFFAGIMRDVSEQKEIEEALQIRSRELERSNAELRQFAYIASHDLQEPLRMVRTYTQLLEKRYRDTFNAEGKEFVTFVVDGVARMQELINDLLAYSKIGHGSKVFEDVELEEVFSSTLSNLQVAIKESMAEVTHDRLPSIHGCKREFCELFQNLISNAIKFHRQHPPKIHVSAKQKENEWVFSVADNGVGIEPQYFERIFVIFQRLYGKTEYPGSGIGLAICKKVVENHGGRIWVESNVGMGSTFFFSIPIKPNENPH